MDFTRVVTGRDGSRASVFLDDVPQVEPTIFQTVNGFAVSSVWRTEPEMPVPETITDPTVKAGTLLPAPGGTSLLVVQFPPDALLASVTDPHAMVAEYTEKLPGLFQAFEPENLGFHTTETVDYGILISGELWLELDGRAQRRIRPGDVVVQNATRHAWRNKSDAPAVIAFVLIGCARP